MLARHPVHISLQLFGGFLYHAAVRPQSRARTDEDQRAPGDRRQQHLNALFAGSPLRWSQAEIAWLSSHQLKLIAQSR